MLKWFGFIFSFLSLSQFAVAQKSFQVQGRIIDSTTGHVVELATVVLKNSTTPPLQYVQLTDLEGRFTFDKVLEDRYTITITSVGYETKNIALIVITNLALGDIKFSTTAKSLGEATVVAKKNLITRTSEKTVFNVAQSPTHQTGTADDALRNMPGVTIDRNGNISMVGKQGVIVLVDGKPSVLAQTNITAFLKSIPANTIESIELITNPSARYDANGNAGIINIKLKKGKNDGLNGSTSIGAGYTDRANGNIVLNYRKNKFNVFGTYALDYKRTPTEFNDRREITLGDTLSHYYLVNRSNERSLSQSLKAGVDYFVNDYNTLSYTMSASSGWSRNPTISHAQNLLGDYQPINTYESNNYEKGDNFSITNDLNYLKKYDSTERELLVDFSHTYVNNHVDNVLHSYGYAPDGSLQTNQILDRHMITANSINNFIFLLNYAEPLKWKGYKLETGLKNETTNNKNDYQVNDKVKGVEANNKLLSNSFDYLENIAAFYVIFNGGYHQWLSYSAGIRSEHTLINSTKTSVSRNYVSFFPSGTISISPSEVHSLSLSYSRRVQRPNFQQINNAVTYFDQYSTWEGNPNLRPSFSDIISLSYTINMKQHMLSFSSDNTFRAGTLSESSSIDANRVTRGTFINGGDTKIIGGSVYAKVQVTKWWELQMNHSFSWQRFEYKQGVNTGPVVGTYYNLWGSMDFKFWHNTVFNINGWFNTGDVFPQGTSKICGMINLSIKKDFLKDKLSISIVAQNFLNTMYFRWNVNNTNLITNGSWQSYNRAVVATITYRFGGAKPTKRKDLEENSRLGGSGKSR